MEHYTQNYGLGVHIVMSHANGRSKPFVPGGLGIRDDNFAPRGLKKSILQEAGCQIGLAANAALWNMAAGCLSGPLAPIRKPAMDPQSYRKCAQYSLSTSDA